MGEPYTMEKEQMIRRQTTRRVTTEIYGQEEGDRAQSRPTGEVNRKSAKKINPS
jgi:hypothetical protein